jgi:hypothetical protein
LPQTRKSKAAIQTCLALGINRISPGAGKPSQARDEAAVYLGKDIRGLFDLGNRPFVSLEHLDEYSLLPTRIANVVQSRKRFGANENETFLFKDIGAIAEADFHYFNSLKNIGVHHTLVLRSIRDIYLETDHFRKLPKLTSLPPGGVGEVEQEALIERITECIRRDPAVRGSLYQIFPPNTPKP